jgi:hypothetical protein
MAHDLCTVTVIAGHFGSRAKQGPEPKVAARAMKAGRSVAPTASTKAAGDALVGKQKAWQVVTGQFQKTLIRMT